MNCITRDHAKKRLKVHAVTPDGRPVCGGGHKARSAMTWQGDLTGPNCARCLQILESRKSESIPSIESTPSTSPEERDPLALTTRETFLALSPDAQVELLFQAEMDRNGFERLYRRTKEDMERETGALKAQISRMQQAEEKDLIISQNQSEEIRQLGAAVRTLHRQIKELGHIPLA